MFFIERVALRRLREPLKHTCVVLQYEEGGLQCSPYPVLVRDTHALDVTQVAVGHNHAALLTRGGEVYCWGHGSGGKLGCGLAAKSGHPQQVVRLFGKGVISVACGHSYTAAVLPSGVLYTWGCGLGGQLGQGGGVLTSVWPARVLGGLDYVRVSSVSCGPFHVAAISDEGQLYTWGDGLFGKLGHGDQQGCFEPRWVETLADVWVLSVSCGWWHTAAAAVPRTGCGGLAALGPSTRSSTSISRQTSGSSSAAWDESQSGVSHSGISSSLGVTEPPNAPGMLYTWGGEFTWQEPGGKVDHHQGCLGHGDLIGRLLPTKVKGEDEICQVACGLNFTVALTCTGHVIQMGRTGAQPSGHKEQNAAWEGAKVPVLVAGAVAGTFVESIAAGMSHVAVVGTIRGSGGGSGGGGGGSGGMRLLTWGKGGAGQLGIARPGWDKGTDKHVARNWDKVLVDHTYPQVREFAL